MAAEEEAPRIIDTSRYAKYIHLGHGSSIIEGGNYVMRTVPEGCIYITYAHSGETANTSNVYNILINSFHVTRTKEYFQNPTIPANKAALLEMFGNIISEHKPTNSKTPFSNTSLNKGVLTISLPGDQYPDARYWYHSNFRDDNILFSSGCYKEEPGIFNELIFTPSIYPIQYKKEFSKKYISSVYRNSKVPGERYMIDYLVRNKGDKEAYSMKEIKEAADNWPMINRDTGKENFFSSSMIVLDTYIYDQKEYFKYKTSNPKKAGRIKKDQASNIAYLNETFEHILRRINDTLPYLAESGITYFPEVFDLKRAIEEIISIISSDGDISVLPVLKETVNRLFFRLFNPRFIPYTTQSFMFANFPGIHINPVCRNSQGATPNAIVAQRRASIGKRTPFNATLAQRIAGYGPLTHSEAHGYILNRDYAASQATKVLRKQYPNLLKNIPDKYGSLNVIKQMIALRDTSLIPKAPLEPDSEPVPEPAPAPTPVPELPIENLSPENYRRYQNSQAAQRRTALGIIKHQQSVAPGRYLQNIKNLRRQSLTVRNMQRRGSTRKNIKTYLNTEGVKLPEVPGTVSAVNIRNTMTRRNTNRRTTNRRTTNRRVAGGAGERRRF